MRFRNAIHITMDNFGSVFKYLLYRFVTAVVFFSLIFVILRLSLNPIVSSPELRAIKEFVKQFVKSVASGNTEWLSTSGENFQELVLEFGRLLSRSGGAIAGAVVGVCIIYLLQRLVDGLATFALGAVVNDRMNTFARTPFFAAYFKNVGKGMLYELVYVPVSFLYNVFMALFCWLFFFYIPALLRITGLIATVISLMMTMTAVACLEALKMTLISEWMPAMIDEKMGVGKAFVYSLKTKKDFGSRFACYLASVYIIVIFNVAAALFTFGSALLLTVPLSFLFLLSIQFVYHYHGMKKRYFISATMIQEAEEDMKK